MPYASRIIPRWFLQVVAVRITYYFKMVFCKKWLLAGSCPISSWEFLQRLERDPPCTFGAILILLAAAVFSGVDFKLLQFSLGSISSWDFTHKSGCPAHRVRFQDGFLQVVAVRITYYFNMVFCKGLPCASRIISRWFSAINSPNR